MLFKPKHIDRIREGEKTVTRRDWAENYNRPSVGSVQMATTEMFQSDEECDCYIRILDVFQQPLGEMDDEDARKEGGYESLEEFQVSWEEIVGEWDPVLVVDVVEFEYVGESRHAGDEHPGEVCGICGADLGIEEGYVTLTDQGILIYCDRDRCRERARELERDVDPEPDETLAAFQEGGQ